MASVPLTPRFAQEACRGLNLEPKIRLIDDFKASGVSELLSSADTSVPQGLDCFLGMATFFKLLNPDCTLRVFSEDFAHAYKTVGIPVAQAKFATIAMAPPTGEPHVATLRTQPFGSARAPANWGRVTKFIQFLMERLFFAVIFIFVDDVFAVEPLQTISSAHKAFTTLCNLLGFELSAAKAQGPAAAIHLLGANVSFEDHHVCAKLPDRKRVDLTNDIRQVLSYNQLNPGQASKLRGRLGFSQSLLFGKVGRAMLQPLTQRQYSKTTGRAHPLPNELRDTLSWWLAALECAPPRTIPYRIVKPVVCYSDACGIGHVAATVIVDGVRHTARTHLPAWFLQSGAGIFECELAGVLLGECLAMAVAPGRSVLLCCDNSGSRAAVIRGSCNAVLGRAISSALWLLAASGAVDLWAEYVRSSLNLADPPSRMCPLTEKPIPCEGVNMGVPRPFADIFTSLDSLFKASFSAPRLSSEMCAPWPCVSCEK